MSRFDVVAVGDCTIDAYTHLHDALTQAKLNSDERLICMRFATKIPLEERVQFVSAGNANNVAVATSRLGLRSALHAVVGKDSNGEFILSALKEASVDTSLMKIDQKNRTNFHVVLSFQGERTILIYHENFEYELNDYDTDWIYFSSISEEQAPRVQEHIIKQADRGIKLAFNPATFQMKKGLDFLKPILAKTEILFMNKEEYIDVLGTSGEPKELMSKMREFCGGILVLTDGPKGSYAMDKENKAWFLGIPDTPVVDRTGTGDAFGSAFTAAIINGLDVPEAMRWGTIESSIKIGFKGPQGGLLTKDELIQKLEQYSNIITKEVVR